MKAVDLEKRVLELVGLDFMPEDSGIVYDNGKEIKRVLAGVDMDTSMLILAKQLGFDAVCQHHPSGIMNPNSSELFGRDHMKKLMECGVPINVAQKLAYKNNETRKQGMHSRNRTQMRDVAKLLDIIDLAYHTPSDILAERTVQAVMDKLMEENPRCKVQDVIDALLTIREFADALEGQKPEVWVGTKESFAGRIYVEMYGVGAPSADEYIACSDAGIGTFVCMHATPEVIKAMKEHGKSNLIVAGHMASDSVGFNQLLADWEAQGIEVVRISGIT